MKHDAWMNDLFLGTQHKLEPRAKEHMSSVQCNDCACEICGVRLVYLKTKIVTLVCLRKPDAESVYAMWVWNTWLSSLTSGVSV